VAIDDAAFVASLLPALASQRRNTALGALFEILEQRRQISS
jgi:hypothetical protein